MKPSDKKTSGVLHQTSAARHFQLRRYLPEPKLASLIEQFWLVDWDLRGQSVRSLQRLFKTYVGLSPKWLIRKYRLHHALEMLESKQLSLAELATHLDYADQSHLIRDFNKFLNITPKQYASANASLKSHL